MLPSGYIFVFVFLCIYYLLQWRRRPKNFPPGPLGIPLFGIAPFAGVDMHKYLATYYAKYGGVMSFRLATKDWIVLNDIEAITQALLKQGESFSGRPQSYLMNQLTEGCGIVFSTGPRWQAQRRFVLTALKTLGMGKRSMVGIINEENQNFLSVIQSSGGKVNILSEFRKLLSNIVTNLIMGKRFNYEDEKLQAIVDHRPTSSVVMFIPFLRFIPPFKQGYQRLIASTQRVLDIISEITEEHKNSFDENNLRDFIDIFLLEMKRRNSEYFTELQLLHLVRDLFVGAIDTTTATLGWGIICLLHYPECQVRIQEEIDDVIGSAEPDMSHHERMPYLRAFIQEVHRFKTIAPLNIPHCVTEDCVLFGYHIPKSTPVMSNIWRVHNDPEYWKNPEKFSPERHLDSEGRFVPSNRVLSFAVGHRSCLGIQLARVELFLFYASTLKKYEFQVDPEYGLPDWSDDRSGTVKTPKKFSVLLKSR
nr:methyl farnesoate epoxidase isoform X1 [Ciona intestinalis]|eukprot:XP_018667221.1 methyl farnesoate epoxidase isoform X1 [Ciona intestinalis]